jgi:hypothetical protein
VVVSIVVDDVDVVKVDADVDVVDMVDKDENESKFECCFNSGDICVFDITVENNMFINRNSVSSFDLNKLYNFTLISFGCITNVDLSSLSLHLNIYS